MTGPVEEYRSNNKGLGYDDGEERFLRIGVGVVEKPEEEDYRWLGCSSGRREPRCARSRSSI